MFFGLLDIGFIPQEDAHDKANGLRLSLETAYKEMGELKRGLMEKEDEAREAQLQKEVEAREKLERQAREDLVIGFFQSSH